MEARLERVLIVEDDQSLQRSLQRALGLRFPAVRACGTRAEASALIAGWRPQLVLLDVMLPDGNALDVLRAAAADGGPQPEVVAMSGFGREDLADALRGLGVHRFLVKPLTPETLEEALRSVTAAAAVPAPASSLGRWLRRARRPS